MYKLSDSNEILLYSLIEGGITAGELLSKLPPEGAITLRINSDGGEVFDALAMYNVLKERDVTVMIDGIAGSAASIVAMAGKKIIMKPGSMMMVHNPATMKFGDSEAFKSAAEVLDKVKEVISGIYAERTGLSTEEVNAMMDESTWMTATEAVEKGFATEIASHDEPVKAEASALSYDDGVKAERQRLRELDGLMRSGREKVINRAKYETGQSAQEIALELLRAEPEKRITNDASNTITAFSVHGLEDHEVNTMAAIINKKRGY